MATTIALACPLLTTEPAKTIFFLSDKSVSSLKISCADFSTANDSPVIALSSTAKLVDSIILASAHIKSPVFINKISPGTISLDGTLITFPPRITFERGVDKTLSDSISFSALLSCSIPTIALVITITRIIIVSI